MTPTPIQPLASLSDLLGIPVYCKRDDMSGFGFGGNKIRKLEFLVYDALAKGCDTLVTCGSNQSNWCRMTAAIGAAEGLEVHLALGGGEPRQMTGNLLLNRILGAHCHHLATNKDAELETAAEALENELGASGKRPYRMIMGGSNGLGTLGYMTAMQEILEQEAAMGIRFDAIVHATGSGGTQAGLIAGKAFGRWPGGIIGISVSRRAAEQRAKVLAVLDQAAELLPSDLASADVIVRDEYAGEGYSRNTAEAEAAIETVARTEGIFLDHVYTGKAAAGLVDMARQGEFGAGQRILFLHTGGSPQLFE